jgi:NAD(P)-dependent dehydrogenase (short-subunit alcohol dehydrogenase family)
VLSRAGSIDILVNNAGVLDVGPAEERTIDEAKAVLETNFFGAVRMTHAVLPSMRGRGAGRIINIGSLAGLLGPPGQAFYAASKFALEGYSEALSHEVAAFGIHVTIIEPGFLKTGLGENAVKVPERIPAYDRLRQAVELVAARGLEQGTNPDEVADVILLSVRSRRPRLRYRVGRDARWLPRVRALIPERMFSAGMKREFRLP